MIYEWPEDQYFIPHQYQYFPSAPEVGYEYAEPYPGRGQTMIVEEADPLSFSPYPMPSYFEQGAFYDPAYQVAPEPEYPAPSYYEEGAYYEPSGVSLGSLWDAFKVTGQALLKSPIFPALIKKDQKNINQYYITPPGEKPDPLNAQLYTPYQRGNTGSVPVPSIIQAGLSPTLLIGAGVILFLMWRKK